MKKKHLVLGALLIAFAIGAGTIVWAQNCSQQQCARTGILYACENYEFANSDCETSWLGFTCVQVACPRTRPPEGQPWVLDYDGDGCYTWDPYEGHYEYRGPYCEIERSGPN